MANGLDIAELGLRVRMDGVVEGTAGLKGLETQGARTEATVNKLAQTTPRFSQAAVRLREPLTSLTYTLAGFNPQASQMASILGSMAVGGGIVTGVLAGITAMSFAYRRMTEDAREVRRAQEGMTASLVKWSEARRVAGLGLYGAETEQLAGATALRDSLAAQIERSGAQLVGGELVGGASAGLLRRYAEQAALVTRLERELGDAKGKAVIEAETEFQRVTEQMHQDRLRAAARRRDELIQAETRPRYGDNREIPEAYRTQPLYLPGGRINLPHLTQAERNTSGAGLEPSAALLAAQLSGEVATALNMIAMHAPPAAQGLLDVLSGLQQIQAGSGPLGLWAAGIGIVAGIGKDPRESLQAFQDAIKQFEAGKEVARRYMESERQRMLEEIRLREEQRKRDAEAERERQRMNALEIERWSEVEQARQKSSESLSVELALRTAMAGGHTVMADVIRLEIRLREDLATATALGDAGLSQIIKDLYAFELAALQTADSIQRAVAKFQEQAAISSGGFLMGKKTFSSGEKIYGPGTRPDPTLGPIVPTLRFPGPDLNAIAHESAMAMYAANPRDEVVRNVRGVTETQAARLSDIAMLQYTELRGINRNTAQLVRLFGGHAFTEKINEALGRAGSRSGRVGGGSNEVS